MATSRGPYKTYLYDASKSIPRTTSWRIKRKREISELEDSPPHTAETTPPDECSSRQLLNDDLPTTTAVTVDFDAECNGSITSADSEDETKDDYDYDSDNFEAELMEAETAEDVDAESIVEDLDQPAYHVDDDLLLPLYPNSQISICGAILAIMSFKRECRLPFSTINRLLVLLRLLCPTDSKLPKSVYMLRKMFKSHHCTTVKKYFCSQCKKECNRSDSCSNDDCNSCLENDTFIKLDLQKQFKTILSRHWNDINYIKRDIADANISATTFLNYDKEYFCCPENVGVILNTDGISIFRSSKVSVWPIYLEVANFPPPIRFRIDNTIICGLWVGQSKPEMDIVMDPILKEIDELNMLGFSFSSPDGVKTVRVKLLFGVFDLVAKSKVLNMNQFNGNYGCPICLHPGEYRERRRIYATDKLYPLRTEEGIEDAIQKATTDNTVVQGIKGQSPLYGYLNLVDGVPPDYMHCVLEGVTKSLLLLWTSPSHHSQPFSVRKDLKVIDGSLCRQSPPHEFTRSPRSIINYLPYWKANEFRYWLLFYSLPLMLHALPSLYFHHYALLVCAMHILLSKEITQTECNAAEEMLTDFCKIFPELYGYKHCSMNMHSLLHITHYVRIWGPCWCHSAFSFESHNGNLKRAITSNQKVADQLAFHVDVALTLQNLYDKVSTNESAECLNFLEFKMKKQRSSMTKLKHGYSIGKVKRDSLPNNLFLEAVKIYPSLRNEVLIFQRLFINDFLLSTAFYKDGEGRRKSCYVYFKHAVTSGTGYGEVQCFAEFPSVGTIVFLKLFNATQNTILTSSGRPCRQILEEYNSYSVISQFIVEVHPTGNNETIIAVPVTNIITNCILVSPVRAGASLYIIKLPNNHENH